MSNLSDALDPLTVPGKLVEPFPGEEGALRCLACGHRCVIRPGRRGICQVRFNQDGVLRVPWGYVAALQADPIEKKPFSHFLPGSTALTFGMLGCDFHCGYCFSGDTMVITQRGPITLAEAFQSTGQVSHRSDGDIAFPPGLEAVTGSGELRRVRGVFKHPYHGQFVILKPYYLPEFQCTADHRLYATEDPAQPPTLVQARDLTHKHYLAVPRHHVFGSLSTLHADEILKDHQVTHAIPWKLSQTERETILAATERGETSRAIGAALGKDPSYIRHIRSKVNRDLIHTSQTSGPLIEDGYLRFPKEHRPGIPIEIPLGESMARLLGYYCAEGSIVQSKDRPNSLVLNFSFSPRETGLADEVSSLLKDCLTVKPQIVTRDTTLGVGVSNSSAALFFKYLCGAGAAGKHIPEALFQASREASAAFLDAYVTGDGHRYPNGKISITTVSRALAYGIAWLALKLGFLPSVYDTHMPETGTIQERTIRRAPHQYSVVWYTNREMKRKALETSDYYLVPLRSLALTDYEGDVYNMEVEGEHQYLANFALVSNCQNWFTSQAMRDPHSDEAVRLVQKVSPEQLVAYARRAGATVIASSYNEPLITTEWAVDVFKVARQAGLQCVFISNGNATPEALAMLRPYLTGYKVDLKSMQDSQYRKLGGVLERVLNTIKMAHDQGLWVEVVTLVVPGFNDSPDELWEAARYLVSVSPDIPWHVTAYHPDYKMDNGPTPSTTLQQAAEIGQEAGLHYVYAGNIPGRVGSLEDTSCPSCNTRLVRRYAYTILDYQVTAQGACPKCGAKIAGVWTDHPESVQLNGTGVPRRVR